MPDIYGKKPGEKMWSDFKKSSEQPCKESEQSQRASEQSCETARPDGGKMPPLVQPLIVVPFASQMQPLYQNGGFPFSYDDMYDDGYDDVEEETVAEESVGVKKEKKVKTKKSTDKRINVGSVFAFIFGLVAIALVAISYFVNIAFINVTESESALAVMISAVKGITENGLGDIKTLLFPLGLIVATLFTLLTFIVSAFSFKRKYPIAGKVFAALALIGAALALIMVFVDKMTVSYGAYALPAVAILMAISAFAAKRRA